METLFKFDGFTVKSRISVTGDNYNQSVVMFHNGSWYSGPSFRENEPTANIMQWAINQCKPKNLTL